MSLSDRKFMQRVAGGGTAPQAAVDVAELAGIGRLTSKQAFDLLAGLDLKTTMSAAPRVMYTDPDGMQRYAWLVGTQDDQSVLRIDDLTTVIVPTSRVAQLDKDIAASEESQESDWRKSVREDREAASRGDVSILHITSDSIAVGFDATRGTPPRPLLERMAAAEGFEVSDIEVVARGRLRLQAQSTGPLGTFPVRSVKEITDVLLKMVQSGDSEAVRLANRSIGYYFQVAAGAQLAQIQSLAYKDLLGAALALAERLPDWNAISKKVIPQIPITTAAPPVPGTSAPNGPSVSGFESGRYGARAHPDAVVSPEIGERVKADPHAAEENFEQAPTTWAVAAGVHMSGPMQFGNELEFHFSWDKDLWADQVTDQGIKHALKTQLQNWLSHSARKGQYTIAAGALEVRDFDRAKREAILTAFTAQRVRAPEGGRE